MKKVAHALLCASLIVVSNSAMAQDTTTAAVLIPEQGSSVLRAGTTVPLKVSEALTTKGKKLKVGHRFRLEVSEPVYLNDKIVIPVGTPAIGEVTDVKNKGMWGKSGKINARVVSMRVGDRTIRLTGQLDDKGKAGTAGVVGAVVALPIAGFFVTGTSAEINVDTPVTGFLDEDVAVAFAPAAAAPQLVVATSPQ